VATRSTGTYDDAFLVRCTKKQKHELDRLAKKAGVSLSEAGREGTREWLANRVDPAAPADPLLAEVRALAAKVEDRFGR
jgi:hypothetical protein